ncbi:MAG: imidazole glycerol phosphate synthase subunit HisF [Bacteroidota bacterium]
MLTKRIIPCLDVKNGRVVKGTRFVNLVDAGDPAEQARYYDKEGADELVFLDITASQEDRRTLIHIAERVAEEIFIPFTIGGGVQTVDDIQQLLRAGADKVSINTVAVEQPTLISKGAEQFGSQCIVVAIDARRIHRRFDTALRMNSSENAKRQKDHQETDEIPSWQVYTHGGKKPTQLDAIEWAQRVEELGAGELLVTSMDQDGTTEGYDVELLRSIAEHVNIPVIASGGAGRLEHFEEAITKGKADALLAASVFHFRTFTIGEVKMFLNKRGIPVRLV